MITLVRFAVLGDVIVDLAARVVRGFDLGAGVVREGEVLGL